MTTTIVAGVKVGGKLRAPLLWGPWVWGSRWKVVVWMARGWRAVVGPVIGRGTPWPHQAFRWWGPKRPEVRMRGAMGKAWR